MCNVKNEQAGNVLKGFRKIDSEGLESFSDTELSKLYATAYALQKEIEKYADPIKASLLSREIDTQVFEDLDKKVLIQDGRENKVFDVAVIGEAFHKAGRLQEFFGCVSFVQAKFSTTIDAKDPLNETVEVNTTKETGASSIGVRKLSKADKAALIN